MWFMDFEYDGKRLSDLGFIVCNFEQSKGANIADIGSKINLNTVSNNTGKSHYLINSQYSECIKSEFDICKDPNIYDDLKIDDSEYTAIIRWLNRNKFLKFRIIDKEQEFNNCYYESSFNIDKISVNDVLYGLRLTMQTNRPFALKDECYVLNIKQENQTTVLVDESDDEGWIYPYMEITIGNDDPNNLINGDLIISNTVGDTTEKMIIKNCSDGEIITVDYPVIYSSLLTHKIQKDFNWTFFGIGNNGSERNNKITVSLPCTIKLSYSPVAKMGI